MKLTNSDKFGIVTGSSNSLFWGWATPDNSKNAKSGDFIIKGCHSSCREEGTAIIRRDIVPTEAFYDSNGKKMLNRIKYPQGRCYLVVRQQAPIILNTDKGSYRTLIEVDKEKAPQKEEIFKLWMKRGMRVLNSFERELGWPLTKLEFPKHDSGGNFFAVFKSPRKWVKSPVTSSIYTLLIRIARKEFDMRLRKRERILEAINSNKKQLFVSRADKEYLWKTEKYGMLFLKNLDLVYGKSKPETIWKNEGFTMGISRFLSNSSGAIVQRRKFNEICIEKGVEPFLNES